MPTHDVTTLDAETLLAMPADDPGRLFAADADTARTQWQRLTRRWHPDRNPERQARWVFTHVQALYRRAEQARASGCWFVPGELHLQTSTGRRFRLRHRLRDRLDIGTVCIGRHVLAYVFEAAFDDLAEHAEKQLRNLPFADAAMGDAMRRHLPDFDRALTTAGATVHVLRKDDEFVPLAHVLRHAGGTLPAAHVAWLLSGLLNVVCYLESTGLAHQAIDIAHVLVSPLNHAVQLSGGWWYAGRQHEPLAALPARSARLAPPDVIARRVADVRLDQFLARATALELLGERLADTPAPMRDFLLLPPAPTALADYERWQQVLWDSFGERRFVPLAITADDIYAMPS